MAKATDAVARVEESQETVHVSPAPDPDAWWYSETADDVEGYDLVKEEALFSLVGVPFMGTRVIFRDGVQRKGSPWRDDYISLELRVAPEKFIQAQLARILSRRTGTLIKDPKAIPGGSEMLVVNDGSTGLYRNVMEYLVAKEQIRLPEGKEKGEKGDSIYDLPRSQWLEGAEVMFDPDGHEYLTAEFEIELRAMRGLRYSDYTNQYTAPGDTAVTFYVA